MKPAAKKSKADILDAMPPANKEAERAVIGSAFHLLPESSDEIFRLLNPGDFYDDANRILFSTLLRMRSRQEPIELKSLRYELQKVGNYESIGSAAYLSEVLQGASVTLASAKYYAEIVKELSAKRRLHNIGEDLLKASANGRKSGDIIADFIGALEVIEHKGLDCHDRLLTTNMADVEPKSLQWFWSGYLPAGSIASIEGDPGEGKSQVTVDIVSRLTSGNAMPPASAENNTYDCGNALLIQAEDDPERTTLPRFAAAGADLSRVELLHEIETPDGNRRLLQLPDDVPLLEQTIIEKRIKLVIFDPLSAYVREGLDENRASDMRHCLAPVAAMAERTQCAILLVRHHNKKENTRAMYRGGGSIAIIAACRAAYCVAPNPDNSAEKVFACVKMNLAPRPASLTYTIEQAGEVSRIVWGGRTELSAADVLKSDQHRGAGSGAKVEEAKEVIEATLANGPASEREVLEACEKAGASRSTYWRARKAMGVVSERSGFGGTGRWLLSMPSMNGAPDEPF